MNLISTSSIMNKSRKELYNLAFKDKTTEVYNRNMLEEFREQFDAMELYVTIIDIDNLKQINDTKGHHEGDMFIKEIANQIQEQANVVFRLGGDEFLALGFVPNSRMFLKKSDDDINSSEVAFVDILGASVGTILKSSTMSLQEAMRSADSIMYENKKGRRILNE